MVAHSFKMFKLRFKNWKIFILLKWKLLIYIINKLINIIIKSIIKNIKNQKVGK